MGKYVGGDTSQAVRGLFRNRSSALGEFQIPLYRGKHGFHSVGLPIHPFQPDKSGPNLHVKTDERSCRLKALDGRSVGRLGFIVCFGYG